VGSRALEAYFDAAGHPDDFDGKALVVCANVSAARTWERFHDRWHAALRRHGIEAPLHMTYFMANREGYESWAGRDDEKAAALLELADLCAPQRPQEFRGVHPARGLGIRETFRELQKFSREWGFMDMRTMRTFCVQFDVPKRGEDREWNPFKDQKESSLGT
jgi:hypothetical protein